MKMVKGRWQEVTIKEPNRASDTQSPQTTKGGTVSDEPEFEMLVHVLAAQKRLLDASEWCTNGKATQTKLQEAYHLLEDVKMSCTTENQRLAEGMVNG